MNDYREYAQGLLRKNLPMEPLVEVIVSLGILIKANLKAYYRHISNASSISIKTRGMLQTVLFTQRAGVLHEDVYERNFIVLDDVPEGHSRVVMVDFRDAVSYLDQPGSRLEDRGRTASLMWRFIGSEQGYRLIHENIEKAKSGGEYERVFWAEMLEEFDSISSLTLA
jgi:hypothetical protein